MPRAGGRTPFFHHSTVVDFVDGPALFAIEEVQYLCGLKRLSSWRNLVQNQGVGFERSRCCRKCLERIGRGERI